jgi:Transglutaminase-like superfamily
MFSFDKFYPLVKKILRAPVYGYKQYPGYTMRVVWAVEKAGPYLLRTKCLAQAFGVYVLLSRKRIRSDIRIGFIKHQTICSAHAWVEADGKVLTGETQNLSFYHKIRFGDAIMGTFRN